MTAARVPRQALLPPLRLRRLRCGVGAVDIVQIGLVQFGDALVGIGVVDFKYGAGAADTIRLITVFSWLGAEFNSLPWNSVFFCC
jgi:hypothetical protein